MGELLVALGLTAATGAAAGASMVPAGLGLGAATAAGVSVPAAAGGIFGTGISGFQALSGAGSILGAFGSFQAGQQQRQIAQYNAALLRNNASAAEVAGMAESGRIWDVNRRKLAAARNTYGASGADVSLGSPVDVMADLAAQGALDQEIARWRGQVSATGMRNEAQSQEYQGDVAARAGIIKAGTTLLNGFGTLASPYWNGGIGGGAGVGYGSYA